MKNDELTLDIQLSPELSAFEANLASLNVSSDQKSLEETRRKGLLELCRAAQESAVQPLVGEKLAATIVKSGEQEITLSLRQYIRSIRVNAALVGLLVGILIGGIAILVLTRVLVPSPPPREPSGSSSAFLKNVPNESLSPWNISH